MGNRTFVNTGTTLKTYQGDYTIAGVYNNRPYWTNRLGRVLHSIQIKQAFGSTQPFPPPRFWTWGLAESTAAMGQVSHILSCFLACFLAHLLAYLLTRRRRHTI